MQRRWMATLVMMMVLPVMAVAGLVSQAAAAPVSSRGANPSVKSPTPTPTTQSVYATYYGWYDNSPPGCATAYSGCAGGTGTYASPITFASDEAEFPVGTVIYYPTVEKYFIMADDCTECDEDWTGAGPDGGPKMYHVDLWTGGSGGNEFDAINCEDALTQGTSTGAPAFTSVIVHPASTEPVSTQPLFNATTGACYGGATNPTNYGQYKNVSSGQCIEAPATKAGTAAVMAACNGAADQNFGFDGAFFVINNLCLGAANDNSGAAETYTACTGGPPEQWDGLMVNNTILGMESNLCLQPSGTALEQVKCKTGSTAQEWVYTEEAGP